MSLSNLAHEFPHPLSRVGPMDNPAKKSQVFRYIVPVSPDAIFADFRVQLQKALHVAGFGEDVGCVPKLRRLDHNCSLKIKDVLVPEEIDATRPAR